MRIEAVGSQSAESSFAGIYPLRRRHLVEIEVVAEFDSGCMLSRVGLQDKCMLAREASVDCRYVSTTAQGLALPISLYGSIASPIECFG
jgi:hypothetical protein